MVLDRGPSQLLTLMRKIVWLLQLRPFRVASRPPSLHLGHQIPPLQPSMHEEEDGANEERNERAPADERDQAKTYQEGQEDC